MQHFYTLLPEDCPRGGVWFAPDHEAPLPYPKNQPTRLFQERALSGSQSASCADPFRDGTDAAR
jgi:hypothetical protein